LSDNPYQSLVENRGAIREMCASKGWAIWIEWVESQKKAYAQKAVWGDTREEREEAALELRALTRFADLPIFLDGMAGKVSATESPAQ